MSSTRSAFSVVAMVVAVGMTTGCHAKFKKAAPTIEDINVQVITTGGPYVELGKVYGGSTSDDPVVNLVADIAAAAVNTVQEVRAIDQTDRIIQAVDVDGINRAMHEGLANTLRGGPPFSYNGGDADATLQLEVLSYGMNVPYLGAPGEFTYSVRARMYQGTERVYKTSMTCTVGVGDPSASAVVLGFVNNVKQLDSMTDDEIDQAFAAIAHYCGEQFVVKMRRHAG